MPQRNNHSSITATGRFATPDGLLQFGGMLSGALLVLVLLISHGGAG